MSIVIYKALVDGIGVNVQAGAKDRTDNIVWLNIPVSADSRHHRQMDLGRGGEILVIMVESKNLSTAVLGVEEPPVEFDLPADHRGGGKVHLSGPDRNQVSPEFFTVKLDIDQPVVVVFLEGERTVDQVVGDSVVVTEPLLYRKGVAAGQAEELGVG